MKFLVTGSTGFVRTHIVKDLIEKHHEVFSCYHNQKPNQDNSFHLDLIDLARTQNIVEQVKPDTIIHLAA